MTYAENTSVSVAKTRGEIEKLIIEHKASDRLFAETGRRSIVQFRMATRIVRFVLELPDPNDRRFKQSPSGRKKYNAAESAAAYEQACRQKWRALLLAIKAKFETVASGIATFEDEFLAYTVMPDGQTVSQHVTPKIAAAYEAKAVTMPLLGYNAGE